MSDTLFNRLGMKNANPYALPAIFDDLPPITAHNLAKQISPKHPDYEAVVKERRFCPYIPCSKPYKRYLHDWLPQCTCEF